LAAGVLTVAAAAPVTAMAYTAPSSAATSAPTAPGAPAPTGTATPTPTGGAGAGQAAAGDPHPGAGIVQVWPEYWNFFYYIPGPNDTKDGYYLQIWLDGWLWPSSEEWYAWGTGPLFDGTLPW